MKNRLMVPVLMVFTAACGSSSGGSGDGAEAGPSNVFTCGNGSIAGSARATDANGFGPVAGATVSAPGCTTAVTDDRGYVEVHTDPGFVMKLDSSASGYMNEHAEFAVPMGTTDGFALTGWAFQDTERTTLFAGWDDSRGYVVVFVSALADAGPCASPEGITLSVEGHPELEPVYMKDLTSTDPALTSTVAVTKALGGALFGPLPPGTYQVNGAKTGCTVSPLADATWQFGASFAIDAGSVTAQLLQME